MIEVREIESDPRVKTPNVINAPMPDHGKGTNAIDNDSYAFYVSEITTPLRIVKKDLLRANLFPGWFDNSVTARPSPMDVPGWREVFNAW